MYSSHPDGPVPNQVPTWLIVVGGVGVLALISALVGWRYVHSVSTERRSILPEAQAPSNLTGPLKGADQLMVASGVNLQAADFPTWWKTRRTGGYHSVDNTDRTSRLSSCLGSSIGGTGVLTGEASSETAPRVYSSDSFSTSFLAGAPRYSYESYVVTVRSASVERSDLARYSSHALGPCMTQWAVVHPSAYPQTPTYTPFQVKRIAGVQAIGFHVRFQIGGSGSETFQLSDELIILGSGRIEASLTASCAVLLGTAEPGCPSPSAESSTTRALMVRAASAAS